MTKRELIEALEADTHPDDAEVEVEIDSGNCSFGMNYPDVQQVTDGGYGYVRLEVK